MDRRAARLVTLVLFLTLLRPAAAQTPRPGTPREWHGTGVVLAVLPPPSDLHATRPVIVIQHEAIPGLMDEAMSMPFLVASTGLFADFKPGDRINFVLRDVPDALLVVSIEHLASRP
ncbi:MAG TPA: copper-binding protein [Dongiaceae bacterium]|nr:copper-binding protein [Dongiaceae bacterium]